MNAKEYLKQYETAARKAQRLREEYELEQEMIDAIRSSSDFDGMPRSMATGKSSTEDLIIRLADKAAKLKAAEIDALALRQEIFETIIKIPDDEGEVLYERYISILRWEEIAVKMNYSWSGIHKLHRRALHLVSDIISA